MAFGIGEAILCDATSADPRRKLTTQRESEMKATENTR